MESTDWGAWHEQYAEPGHSLAGRLAQVQASIGDFLDATAPAPMRVVSACAGDGRDLLGVLSDRDDAARVTGRLVEQDARLAETARRAAARLPAAIEVVTGDAGASEVYEGAAPADLVLLCGIFGNISDSDIQRTVVAARRLCAPGALVVWTRGRGGSLGTGRAARADLTSTIRGWFSEAGFDEVSWTAPDQTSWSVGVARLAVAPSPLIPGERWFSFGC